MSIVFPGMSPYLEDASLWPAFHRELITSLEESLHSGLRERYATQVLERRYSAADPAADSELEPVVQEQYIELRDRRDGRWVTLVDVVSPRNKTTERGRLTYLRTRRIAHDAGAHLVEIDLVLLGDSTIEYSRDNLPEWDYAVTVTRATQPERHEIYTSTLAKRLPRFRLPLAAGDTDFVVDLPAVFARTMERGAFAAHIDYRQNPPEEVTARHAYRIWEREGRPQGRDKENWIQAIAALKPSPQCVEKLDLSGTPIGDESLQELKEFTSLQALVLSGASVTDAGLAYLRHVPHLQSLSVDRTAVTDAGLRRLRGLGNLERLVLYATQITDAGLNELRRLPKLQALVLTETAVTDAGMRTLGRLKGLRELFLNRTAVTDLGVQELRELQNLQMLVLDDTRVTGVGLRYLQKLGWLYVQNTSVTDEGLQDIGLLADLKALYVNGSQITDAGLSACGKLTSLQALHLGETAVTDAGLKELKNLTNLAGLYLANTRITDAGVTQLADLPKLQVLNLLGTKVTDAGVQSLQKALPHCQISIGNTGAASEPS